MRKLIVVGSFLLSTAALADDSYKISVDAPPSKKAIKSTVKIHLAPGTGYHVNKDFPTRLNVASDKSVTVDKPTQQLAESGADFEVAYTSADAGKKTFSGELRFAVCSATSCDPKKEKVSFTVEVK